LKETGSLKSYIIAEVKRNY